MIYTGVSGGEMEEMTAPVSLSVRVLNASGLPVRSASGRLLQAPRRSVRSLTAQWRLMNREEVNGILSRLSGENLYLSYTDPRDGGQKAGQFLLMEYDVRLQYPGKYKLQARLEER